MRDTHTQAAQTIEAPVREVAVLEDRARVTRRGRVTVAAGSSRVRVEGVAPVLVDKTLTASVRGGPGARVNDVRAVREWKHEREARPEAVREIEELIDAAERARAEIEGRRMLVSARVASLQAIADRALDELAEDTSWGRADAEAGTRTMRTLAEQERAALDALAAADADLAEARRQSADLVARRSTLLTPSTSCRASVLVEVVADQPGELELTLEYLVPGACWRPYHTARLVGDRVRFDSDACVWQRTGEDWTDVELAFSTERASLGTEPPELASDVLATRKKSAAVVVAAREHRIQTVGLGAATTTADELPGIDDGGSALLLRAEGVTTVPSDGRPHRVRVFGFDSAAQSALVLRAEIAGAVVLETIQEHLGAHPLLAGPVDLVRESGLVGRTELTFVAAKERFRLCWGPDAALRVHREHDVLDTESKLLSSWVASPNRVELRLSNLDAKPLVVRVIERIPVSEIDKVKIAIDDAETTPGGELDDDGMMRWTSTVPAHGRLKLKLAYTVTKHPDVVGV